MRGRNQSSLDLEKMILTFTSTLSGGESSFVAIITDLMENSPFSCILRGPHSTTPFLITVGFNVDHHVVAFYNSLKNILFCERNHILDLGNPFNLDLYDVPILEKLFSKVSHTRRSSCHDHSALAERRAP